MFQEKLRMDGKVAMVVGAGGGGHGTATSIALAEAGADIVAVDINADTLKDVEQRVQKFGVRFLPLHADVRKKEDVERIVSLAIQEFGAIHSLANIVGGMQHGQWASLLDCTEQTFDDILGLNLRYAFLTCQAVARTMVELKIPGSIVNVSSVSSLPTAPSHGAYGAAKRGLNALTETMALEWSEYRIRVNAVAPGNMRVPRQGGMTGGPRMLTFDDVTTTFNPTPVVPLGRNGTPLDIGAAILFLLSDLSSYITGQLLVVDGGLSVKAITVGDAIRAMPVARAADNR